VIRRRSPARLRVAIAGAALIGLNLLTFAAFTWPGLTRVRRAEDRAVAASKRRSELEGLWARVNARQGLVQRNRQDIDDLLREHLRSRSTDLFAAQREIEVLAREAGLRPTRSTYSLEPIRGTGLVRCEVRLPLDGSYQSLTSFLGRVASTKRFIVVDQMGLSDAEGGARMNLTLSAIFKDGTPDATR
jgi:hypothetical protein